MGRKQTLFKPFNVKYLILTIMYLLGSYGWLIAFAPQPAEAQTGISQDGRQVAICDFSNTEQLSFVDWTISPTIDIEGESYQSHQVLVNGQSVHSTTSRSSGYVVNLRNISSVAVGQTGLVELKILSGGNKSLSLVCGRTNVKTAPVTTTSSVEVSSCTVTATADTFTVRLQYTGETQRGAMVLNGTSTSNTGGKQLESITTKRASLTFAKTIFDRAASFNISVNNTAPGVTNGFVACTGAVPVAGKVVPPGPITDPDPPGPTPQPVTPVFRNGTSAGSYYCTVVERLFPNGSNNSRITAGQSVEYTVRVSNYAGSSVTVGGGQGLQSKLNGALKSNVNPGFPSSPTGTVDRTVNITFAEAGDYQVELRVPFFINGTQVPYGERTCANTTTTRVDAADDTRPPVPDPNPDPQPTNNNITACAVILSGLPPTSTDTYDGYRVDYRIQANSGQFTNGVRYEIARDDNGTKFTTQTYSGNNSQNATGAFNIMGGAGIFRLDVTVTNTDGSTTDCTSYNRLNGQGRPAGNPIEDETQDAQTVEEFKNAFRNTICTHDYESAAAETHCLESFQDTITQTCASVADSSTEQTNCEEALICS